MNIIAEKKIKLDLITIYFTLVKLYRGYILLISDHEEFGLGSISLSTPPINEALKSTSVSYQLFGMEHNLLSKMIVEKASYNLNEPVVLLLFLKEREKEKELIRPIMNGLQEILIEYQKQKNKEE
jgi:hypothetical protein